MGVTNQRPTQNPFPLDGESQPKNPFPLDGGRLGWG